MTSSYQRPEEGLEKFHCPHCDTFALQIWKGMYPYLSTWQSRTLTVDTNPAGNEVDGFQLCVCYHCEKFSLWHMKKMVHPASSVAPPPHSDLPEKLKSDYEEARAIATRSPRGAAALMRLVIQQLCAELGESGKNINKDIGELVQKGLPPKIQKSLDAVRVIGNNAVHPGKMDVTDTPDIVNRLFYLVNFIVQVMITQPKMVDAIYEGLPESSKKAIENRDSP